MFLCHVPCNDIFIQMIFCMDFLCIFIDRTVQRDDRKELGGERERDQQRTLGRESNSARRERSMSRLYFN